MTEQEIMDSLVALGNLADGRPAVLTVNDRTGTEGKAHLFFSLQNGKSETFDADTIDGVIKMGFEYFGLTPVKED